MSQFSIFRSYYCSVTFLKSSIHILSKHFTIFYLFYFISSQVKIPSFHHFSIGKYFFTYILNFSKILKISKWILLQYKNLDYLFLQSQTQQKFLSSHFFFFLLYLKQFVSSFTKNVAMEIKIFHCLNILIILKVILGKMWI